MTCAVQLWRRAFAAFALAAFTGGFVIADEPRTPLRIGVIVPPEARFALGEGLREGLIDLGYVEGKTLSFDWRPAAAAPAELRASATELARGGANLIVAFSTPSARAALDATTLPLVFMAGDPIAAGLARSLAKPGGRATGISVQTADLTAKRLELLRGVAPSARRVVHIVTLANPNNALQVSAAQQAAKVLNLELLTLDTQHGVDAALAKLPALHADAVLVGSEVSILANRAKIARALAQAKLPAIFPSTQFHEAGVLMSFGPNVKRAARTLAGYVDKIYKGADPANLPIEQVSRYELVINQGIARSLGLALPKDLLLRADEVIK
jgi:putative tryptophan/tyrosine transport system substrate-binding protein